MPHDKIGIVGEPAGGVTVHPAAGKSVPARQVPVVERGEGPEPAFQHRIQKPVIEGDAVRIYDSVAFGKQARPGKGKPVGAEAAVGDKVQILGEPVVVIAGNRPVRAVRHTPRLAGEIVPVRWTASAKAGSFDLVARGCHTEQEFRRQLRYG